MDRLPVHRAAAGRPGERFGRCIRIEWLPAYAPGLNPDVQVWNHAKYTDLVRFIPDDVNEPGHIMAVSFRKRLSQRRLLRSFFPRASPPL